MRLRTGRNTTPFSRLASLLQHWSRSGERSKTIRVESPATPGDIGFAFSVKFRLTSHRPSVCFFPITEDQLQFTPDMKKLFTLTMLISFAMFCSCQKQDSAAEQQLAQRKAELDAREKALDEREKALAEREQLTTNMRPIPPIVPRRTLDAAQAKAERDRRIQQLPPEAQRLILDPAQVAQRDQRRQQMLERLQRMRSGAAGSPAAAFTNPSAASPAVEATSPSPSPTPQ
jgi:hypothetical protein